MKKTALVVLAVALVGIVAAAGCISNAANSDTPVGEWIISGTDVTLSLKADGTFAGQSYVNRYFGEYTIDGNKIVFNLAGSTMMFGPDMEKEDAFFKALAGEQTFELADGKLVLSGGLTFTEAPKSVVGSWETAEGVTIIFNEDGTFAGKGPVNNYFGTYTQNGESLTLEQTGATMMAGPDLEAEGVYFESLKNVAGFTVTDAGLTLVDANGKAVVSFEAQSFVDEE